MKSRSRISSHERWRSSRRNGHSHFSFGKASKSQTRLGALRKDMGSAKKQMSRLERFGKGLGKNLKSKYRDAKMLYGAVKDVKKGYHLYKDIKKGYGMVKEGEKLLGGGAGKVAVRGVEMLAGMRGGGGKGYLSKIGSVFHDKIGHDKWTMQDEKFKPGKDAAYDGGDCLPEDQWWCQPADETKKKWPINRKTEDWTEEQVASKVIDGADKRLHKQISSFDINKEGLHLGRNGKDPPGGIKMGMSLHVRGFSLDHKKLRVRRVDQDRRGVRRNKNFKQLHVSGWSQGDLDVDGADGTPTANHKGFSVINGDRVVHRMERVVGRGMHPSWETKTIPGAGGGSHRVKHRRRRY